MKLGWKSFQFEFTVGEFITWIGLIVAPFHIMRIIKTSGEKNKMANKDFGEWLDVVVETASAYKAAKADGAISLADTILIIPILAKLPAAIEGSSVAFKDLSVDDLKAAAVAILDASGDVDPKHAVYVASAFSIVAHGVGIVSDVKAIMAA